MPNTTDISKIIVHNRLSLPQRLDQTKIYANNLDYNGTIINTNLIGVLSGSSSAQIFTYDSYQNTRYLLLKADQSNCLHISEIDVYGEIPQEPVLSIKNTYTVLENIKIGDIITSVNAIDYQGDVLNYGIVQNNTPFIIDSNNNLVVNGALTGTYNINIRISDTKHTINIPIKIIVNTLSQIERAISSGITENITEEGIIQATLYEIDSFQNKIEQALVQILNLNNNFTIKDDNRSLTNLTWNPGRNSSSIGSIPTKNTPFLITNDVRENSGLTVYKKEIGILGEKSNSRYIVLGGNPFATSINQEMNQVMKNSISWLTKRDDLETQHFNVILAHLTEGNYAKYETKTRAWLDLNYPNLVSYNVAESCNGSALKDCINNNTDLLIVSQFANANDNLEEIIDTINKALDDGIAVMYVHYNYDISNLEELGEKLFSSVFNVIDKKRLYWNESVLKEYNPIENITDTQLLDIRKIFQHFKDEDYEFDWSECYSPYNSSTKGENQEVCTNVVDLYSEFLTPASKIKEIIDNLDKNKIRIFDENKFIFEKLFILTADKLRQNAQFPMTKLITNTTELMKSYYSDHAVYNFRDINNAQGDMGNFSRSDFSNITPTNRTISTMSKKNFRATGAYAIPGKTVNITRNDDSNTTLKVFINSIRSGSTHEFQRITYNTPGYNRPKYLQSVHIELIKDEPIEITSPYGGPLQLEFFENNLPINVTFENIGEHPYWSNSDDDDSFTQKMAENDFDWAEISTQGFEVHSTLSKMNTSISDAKWGGTTAGLANAIVKYTSNYPHVLAGFKGQDIDVVPEIHDWANDLNITINNIDIVKHMNADQPTCGYGCSGNPYDAGWAFNPIAHGDIHEMGHSMQKKRFEGFANHAATNTFAYYTKQRYFENTGENGGCQDMPFKSFFELIQSSVGENNITEYLQPTWTNGSTFTPQYLMKIQAMMHAQALGKIDNGWHVLARVHILEREKAKAKLNWEEKKDSIGFSNYTLAEFNSIRDNDWLVISYSFAASLDYRNYFDMMGIPYSQKARDQIASFGYEVVPNSLFVSTGQGYCISDEYGTLFDRPTLPIDGNTSYAY